MLSRLIRVLLVPVAAQLLSVRLHAAELRVDPSELPRIPAHEPADALQTFSVKSGFHLEIAAHEPEVVDPVTMCFDEHGRLFVVEMIDYSERREEDPHLGRVRLLTDTNGDGRFDRATVYADRLPWPTAVVCYDGGIFVGATPDIIWCRDTDGDGRAEERKVVFTGFGAKASKLNVQALFNSFQWGLDNRIHGTCGTIGGSVVTRPDQPQVAPVNLNRVDFSFDPKRMDLRPETGGGQYGMSFDSNGRKFMCSNSDHAQAAMYDYRYLGGDSLHPLPSHRVSIAADGKAAEVFRLSADEPWRVIRTRWRISGVVRGMVEGGGRVSGYFTGATGLTVFQGDAYGAEFADNLFVGDAGGNLVHRKQVDHSTLPPVASRPTDERNSEFIASTDNWFRPVHFANGPDGCLYIADMYRETIEHPWSLPEPIKQHLDLNSGNDRGRIYRVVKDGVARPAVIGLATKTTPELVRTLAHPNGWHRNTAARLLYQRAAPNTADLIRQEWHGGFGALGKIHALHLLASLGLTEISLLEASLTAPDETVRRHGLMLTESVPLTPALVRSIAKLGEDPAVAVRFQLGLTLGILDTPDKNAILNRLLQRKDENTWVIAAALCALRTGIGETFTKLDASNPMAAEALARMAGASGNKIEISKVLRAIDENWERPGAAASLNALDEGLRSARDRLVNHLETGALSSRFDRMRKLAGNSSAGMEARIRSVHAIKIAGFDYCGKTLTALLDKDNEAEVKNAALTALLDMTETAAFSGVVANWESLEDPDRRLVIRSSLNSRVKARSLLAGVERGSISKELFGRSEIAKLRDNRDKSIAEAAVRVFGPPPAQISTSGLLKRYQDSLKMEGDANAGSELFLARCVACHRANGGGHALGPDLVTVKSKGREHLLVNILDPNAEVAPQYLAFEVDSGDDESFTALLTDETPSRLTLKMAGGLTKTLTRKEVKGMRSSGKSLMPEGLHEGLSPAQMANLLRFIETAQ